MIPFSVHIGKFKLEIAPLSMIIVFISLSTWAMVSAFNQFKPEYPMPLSSLIFVNEGLAIAGTMLYGIILHLVLVIIKKHHEQRVKE